MKKFKKRGVDRTRAAEFETIKKLIDRCYPLNQDKFFASDNHRMKVMLSLSKLKELVEAKGIKPTFQRLKILEYLYKHIGDHPTAEIIYEAMGREIPAISMATIYNSLNALLDKGLVSAVTITGKEIRYDVDTSSHHHLLCRKCGRIFDIDLECPLSINNNQPIDGHYIEKAHGYFNGICKECRKTAKSKKPHAELAK
jgi:Fur family transcriptional regulator, peroxide stress response regulator